MAGRTRIVWAGGSGWRGAGLKDIMALDTLKTELEKRGRSIAAAAGPGYGVQVYKGRFRWRITVRTETDDARDLEAKGPSRLLPAVKAGR